MKKCIKCGSELPLTTEFYTKYASKSNKFEPGESWHTKCKQCELEEKLKDEWCDGLLKCHCCGKYFPEEEFHKTGHNYIKHNCRNNRDKRCPNCKAKKIKESRQKYSQETALLKILNMRYYGCKQRATEKKLDFDLTKDYLKQLWDKQNGICALSGIAMTFDIDSGRTNTNVSVDKINPNLGYTKDNIQLVCMAVNQMKSDLRLEELYMFCEALLWYKDSKNAKKWHHGNN